MTLFDLAKMYTPDQLEVIFAVVKARLGISRLCRAIITTDGVELEVVQRDDGNGSDSNRTMDPHFCFGTEGTIANDDDAQPEIMAWGKHNHMIKVAPNFFGETVKAKRAHEAGVSVPDFETAKKEAEQGVQVCYVGGKLEMTRVHTVDDVLVNIPTNKDGKLDKTNEKRKAEVEVALERVDRTKEEVMVISKTIHASRPVPVASDATGTKRPTAETTENVVESPAKTSRRGGGKSKAKK